jgi:hypothetical protein
MVELKMTTGIIIKIYFSGALLLIGAIIINGIAKYFKLPTWYDFLANYKLSIHAFFWLFILYPLALGSIVYLLKKFTF